jgi:hypothetical protein
MMPANGHAPALVGVVAAGYAILAALYWLGSGRRQSSSGFGGGPVTPPAAAQSSSS